MTAYRTGPLCWTRMWLPRGHSEARISLPPFRGTLHLRQVRYRLITEALMREPAAACSCQDPYCLAGLMAIPWDHTFLLPQHAGKCGSNHNTPLPSLHLPWDLFLKSKGDRCEKRNKTKSGRKLIWSRRLRGSMKRESKAGGCSWQYERDEASHTEQISKIRERAGEMYDSFPASQNQSAVPSTASQLKYVFLRWPSAILEAIIRV